MTTVAALGDGPVVFFTQQGQQISIPLAEIYFEGGAVKTDFPVDAADKSPLASWLKFLVETERLKAGTTPLASPPVPAVILTAATAGSAGNNIKVEVLSNTPDDTQVDVRVTETDTYHGLTLDTLADVLGMPPDPGKKPGLLRLKQRGTAIAITTTGPIDPVIPATDPPTWLIAGAGGDACILEAARDHTDSALLTVSIEDQPADPVTGVVTFTLIAEWQDIAENVEIGNLADKLRELAFAVTFTAPDGAPLAVPSPITLNLTGGDDPAEAVNAKATLFTDG